MRAPGEKELRNILLEFMYHHGTSSLEHERIIFDTLGYGCFKWQVYKGDLIIFAKPEHEKLLKGFRENIAKKNKCGNVTFLPEINEFAFIIPK